jgi:hypothetical protein
MTVAVPITMSRLAVAALVCGTFWASFSRAQEPAATGTPTAADYVLPYVDKKCDDVNSSWLITNKHTHLSIQVTIQWQPVGGKQKEETVVLSPQERRPVGCAPTVQIVSAILMQF